MKTLLRNISFILALILSGWAIPTSAQRRCSSNEVLQHQLNSDPTLAAKRRSIEVHTENFVDNYSKQNTESVIRIPVVVHVVYRTSFENISDSQIVSQLSALNADFRKQNADRSNVPSVFQSVIADMGIEFVLANRDPNGNPTTGIVRKNTYKTLFYSNTDEVKYSSKGGSTAWPSGQYLNIWVCNLGGGDYGYGTYPGGPDSTDGIVVKFNAFGTCGQATAPYDKGRTLTHEVGHWLNLMHIWGDNECGNDFVEDTPPQKEANFGMPLHPHASCTNNGDMFMNFMDYSDDASLLMFSEGQKARVLALFASGGYRSSLLTSTGYVAPIHCPTISLKNPTALAADGFNLVWDNPVEASSVVISCRILGQEKWMSKTVSSASVKFTSLKFNTTYEVVANTVCGSVRSLKSSPVYVRTLNANGCAEDATELGNSMADSRMLEVGKEMNAAICPAGDLDWYTILVPSGQNNVKIKLANLPSDFDLEVYDADGKKILGSYQSGLREESIVLNNVTPGVYRVLVYGYREAFNATGTYNLTAELSNTYFPAASTATQKDFSVGANRVYPNPARDEFNVSFNSISGLPVAISIIDQSGKLVKSEVKQCLKGENMFNFSTEILPAGLYFIRIQCENASTTSRLLVQK